MTNLMGQGGEHLKNPTIFYEKSIQNLGIEGNFLGLKKDAHGKLKETSCLALSECFHPLIKKETKEAKVSSLTISTQHYSPGPRLGN